MNRKTVLITGSSRGIGKAIAMRFAKENFNIIINCVSNKELLDETKREIESLGSPCLAYVGDMGDVKKVDELFQLTKERFGGIDILINNAGISQIGLLTDMTIEQWTNIMNTNLNSVFYCSRLAIPHMLSKQAGKIINISSVWGVVGASCEVAYSTTKGGVNSFTKALAKELAPSGIQVNAIACGAIDTDMNHFLDSEELQCLIDEIPTSRLGRAEEVAHLAFQLCEENHYLTGQVISLDGGWQ